MLMVMQKTLVSELYYAKAMPVKYIKGIVN